MGKVEKASKQEIIKAGVDLIRAKQELSARNLAKALNISTQPIYRLFKNMDSLLEEVKAEGQNIHNQYIHMYFGKVPKYKAFGMGFVKFAKEESELFKLLYITSPQTDKTQQQYYDVVINEMAKSYNISKEKALMFHQQMTIYSYGLAILQSHFKNMSDEEVSQCLTTEFEALKKQLLF